MPAKEGSNQIRLGEAVINIGSGIILTKSRDDLQPKKSYQLEINGAYIQQIVTNVIASMNLQPPAFASAPSGFQNGQMYINTTNGLLYVMVGGTFRPADTQDGNTVQDLIGNTIVVD
jgi:hypothetical protein